MPEPWDCQRNGVAVADNDVITGRIVAEHYLPDVSEQCNGHDGCTCATGTERCIFITAKGEYEIYYNNYRLITHEQCHALYEETRHTNA